MDSRHTKKTNKKEEALQRYLEGMKQQEESTKQGLMVYEDEPFIASKMNSKAQGYEKKQQQPSSIIEIQQPIYKNTENKPKFDDDQNKKLSKFEQKLNDAADDDDEDEKLQYEEKRRREEGTYIHKILKEYLLNITTIPDPSELNKMEQEKSVALNNAIYIIGLYCAQRYQVQQVETKTGLWLGVNAIPDVLMTRSVEDEQQKKLLIEVMVIDWKLSKYNEEKPYKPYEDKMLNYIALVEQDTKSLYGEKTEIVVNGSIVNLLSGKVNRVDYDKVIDRNLVAQQMLIRQKIEKGIDASIELALTTGSYQGYVIQRLIDYVKVMVSHENVEPFMSGLEKVAELVSWLYWLKNMSTGKGGENSNFPEAREIMLQDKEFCKYLDQWKRIMGIKDLSLNDLRRVYQKSLCKFTIRYYQNL